MRSFLVVKRRGEIRPHGYRPANFAESRKSPQSAYFAAAASSCYIQSHFWLC
jgi:hypothetical protein